MSQELSSQLSESEKNDLKESIHHLLKWAWRYNKNLEEQAAQLHMLTGWSQIVEVSRMFTYLLIICVCWKFDVTHWFLFVKFRLLYLEGCHYLRIILSYCLSKWYLLFP
jgi:hypothetical protein